jgi:hypothetical protein
MLDSHYRPVARIITEVGKVRNTFYAIFLRHLLGEPPTLHKLLVAAIGKAR